MHTCWFESVSEAFPLFVIWEQSCVQEKPKKLSLETEYGLLTFWAAAHPKAIITAVKIRYYWC